MKKHAIVIGVNRAIDKRSLLHAESDAKKLAAEILYDLGFSYEMLLGNSVSSEAIRQALLRVPQDYSDGLLIWYSGHGVISGDGTFCFCCNEETIPINEILEYIPVNAQKVVLIDACRIKSEETGGCNPSFPENIRIGYSCHEGTYASDGEECSPYLDALQSAIKNSSDGDSGALLEYISKLLKEKQPTTCQSEGATDFHFFDYTNSSIPKSFFFDDSQQWVDWVGERLQGHAATEMESYLPAGYASLLSDGDLNDIRFFNKITYQLMTRTDDWSNITEALTGYGIKGDITGCLAQCIESLIPLSHILKAVDLNDETELKLAHDLIMSSYKNGHRFRNDGTLMCQIELIREERFKPRVIDVAVGIFSNALFGVFKRAYQGSIPGMTIGGEKSPIKEVLDYRKRTRQWEDDFKTIIESSTPEEVEQLRSQYPDIIARFA